MNETKAIVDPQGFREAADAFDRASTVNMSALAYHVQGSMSRVVTLLRALGRVLETNDPWIYKDEIHDLVEMANEAVVDPEDVFDQMDRFETDMKHAFVQYIEERKHLNKIIDAFEVCSRPASLNEINQAAATLHELACSDPAYNARWLTFGAYMKGCGLVAEMRPITPNGPLHLWVDYAESGGAPSKAKRKAKRATKKAARAAAAAGRASA